jgi:predicted phosphodiesterase
LAGAGTVVFNGDTWQEVMPEFRGGAAEMLDELRALCGELGVAPVFLPGNHDPGWAGAGWVELAGGRVVVTHGDTLCAAGSPWTHEVIRRGAEVRELWRRHPMAATDVAERFRLAHLIAREFYSRERPGGRSLLDRVRSAVCPPRRAWEILRAWFGQPDNGAKFCERYFPKAEVLVIGHFHRPGAWRRRGRLIVNTGAYVNPSAAWWAEWGDGRLRWGRVMEQADSFLLGGVRGEWREE